MELFSLFSPILVAAALFSYLNHRVMKLPTTIGVMLIALVMSLGLILLHFLGVELQEPAVDFLEKLRFREALLDGMLAFLLFAGALHIDLKDLFGQIRVVATLATLGVVASAVLVGFFLRHLTLALGLEIPFIHCLLFGALISPTDPIAVLGILKSAGAPKSLEIKIAGESLFNDGIGVVVFSVILGLARPGAHAEEAVAVTTVVGLLAQEVIGSLLLGYAAGWLAYRLLKTVDNYQVEVLITLALAMGV
jgi:CPA1 family monovalent cation:H+ antiporter